MLNFIKNKFPHTIKSKIICTTVLITLTITLSIASICFYIFQSQSRENLVKSMEFSLQTVMNSITIDLENIAYLASWGNANSQINTFLYSERTDKKAKLDAYASLKEAYQSCKSHEYITRFMIGNIQGNFIQEVKNTNEGSASNYKNTINSDFFKTLLEDEGFKWIGLVPDPVFRTNNPKQIIPIVRPIYSSYNSNIIGFAYISVSSKIFTDALKNYPIEADSRVYITIDSKKYILEAAGLVEISPDLSKVEPFNINTLDQKTYSCVITDAKNDAHTLITYPSTIDGIYISQSISINEFQKQRNTYFILLLLIIIIILTLGIFLTIFINRIINKPITKIRTKIQAISEGDFSYEPAIEWEDELGDIGKGINTLSKDVITLMDKRISDEKHKKELEYQILQNQINPHFLYNTLNSIKWMATIQNAVGIAEMTTALSRLLKSISKDTNQIIQIKDELELLKNYILIQTYRYGGTIAFEYNIQDEAILNFVIPKFTLQPIVENAIFHGIEAKGANGIITISMKKRENLLIIDITDNGVGISDELIEQILHGEDFTSKNDFFKKIGISNVNNRIKYTFGEAYGITITSIVNEYTKMSINIPCVIKEDIN